MFCVGTPEVVYFSLLPCMPGATLATLASNEETAAFIMAATGDSVAKAMLALLEVEDEDSFSHAGTPRQGSPLVLT